jgi:hypothetical protein
MEKFRLKGSSPSSSALESKRVDGSLQFLKDVMLGSVGPNKSKSLGRQKGVQLLPIRKDSIGSEQSPAVVLNLAIGGSLSQG